MRVLLFITETNLFKLVREDSGPSLHRTHTVSVMKTFNAV